MSTRVSTLGNIYFETEILFARISFFNNHTRYTLVEAFCELKLHVWTNIGFFYQGVEAFPIRDGQMFEWMAKLLGPKDTYWEGKSFFITVTL